MFKQATSMPHFLGAGRPVVYNEETGEGRILGFDDLDTVDKLEQLLKKGKVVSPDHIFDGSEYVRVVMEDLDSSLRDLASRILNNKNEETGDNYSKVLIFANCGFGPVVSEDSDVDGVLRDKNGIAYGVRSQGKTLDYYVKVGGRGQNTPHLHVQVLALKADSMHGNVLKKTLSDYCIQKDTGTLKDYRGKAPVPCVAVCQVKSEKQLANELVFNLYSEPKTDDDSLSGIARDTIANHASEVLGLNTDDHKKEYMAVTTAYGRQIA